MNDSGKRDRIDFQFRFQTFKDTPEGILMSYLSSGGTYSSKQLVLQVLRMCYLPYAYKDRSDFSEEKLKAMALESCNALENHASYIRQMFGLERPIQQIPHSLMRNDQSSISPQLQSQSEPMPAPKPEPLPEPKRESLIKGDTTPEEMEILFGDM